MTYSVKWTETTISFAHRFDVYLDYPFFEHQVDIAFFIVFSHFVQTYPNLSAAFSENEANTAILQAYQCLTFQTTSIKM